MIRSAVGRFGRWTEPSVVRFGSWTEPDSYWRAEDVKCFIMDGNNSNKQNQSKLKKKQKTLKPKE